MMAGTTRERERTEQEPTARTGANAGVRGCLAVTGCTPRSRSGRRRRRRRRWDTFIIITGHSCSARFRSRRLRRRRAPPRPRPTRPTVSRTRAPSFVGSARRGESRGRGACERARAVVKRRIPRRNPAQRGGRSRTTLDDGCFFFRAFGRFLPRLLLPSRRELRDGPARERARPHHFEPTPRQRLAQRLAEARVRLDEPQVVRVQLQRGGHSVF